jgi:DNA-binding transcriptional ArsR family regulator
MFGLSARAEILRCFLAQPRTSIKSVTSLAAATGYTKRNVTDECDMLERSGLLTQRVKANRFYYSLARRSELEALVGDLPDIRPDWSRVLHIARQLVTLEDASRSVGVKTFPIRVRKTLTAIKDDLAELDIDADFADAHGSELWPATQELASRTLATWSIGHWVAPHISQNVRRIGSAP